MLRIVICISTYTSRIRVPITKYAELTFVEEHCDVQKPAYFILIKGKSIFTCTVTT